MMELSFHPFPWVGCNVRSPARNNKMDFKRKKDIELEAIRRAQNLLSAKEVAASMCDEDLTGLVNKPKQLLKISIGEATSISNNKNKENDNGTSEPRTGTVMRQHNSPMSFAKRLLEGNTLVKSRSLVSD